MVRRTRPSDQCRDINPMLVAACPGRAGNNDTLPQSLLMQRVGSATGCFQLGLITTRINLLISVGSAEAVFSPWKSVPLCFSWGQRSRRQRLPTSFPFALRFHNAHGKTHVSAVVVFLLPLPPQRGYYLFIYLFIFLFPFTLLFPQEGSLKKMNRWWLVVVGGVSKFLFVSFIFTSN